MNPIIIAINSRREILLRRVGERKKALAGAPEGRLRITGRENKYQFYAAEEGKRNTGKYLSQGSEERIRALAQKAYDRKVLAASLEELKILDAFQSKLTGVSAEEIYGQMTAVRRKLISPIELPDEEYFAAWENKPYKKKPLTGDVAELYTAKGDLVRSKSEIILADCFYRHHVPYRYECALPLDNRLTVYPDFTALCLSTRKVRYHEHLGMLDVPEYCEMAVRKLTTYMRNGIMLGDQLTISWETKGQPLTSRDAEKIISHYYL